MPAVVYAQSSINHLENRNIPNNVANTNSNGIGDTTLVFSLWPYIDRAKEEYLGMAAYLTIPTGDYDRNRAFNIGSNIYQTALQAGYQRKLVDNINWMAALDALVSADNNQYLGSRKLEKDPLYNFQTGLQYVFNPTYSASLGYFYTVGGGNNLDSIDQGKINKINRYQITGQGIYNFGRICYKIMTCNIKSICTSDLVLLPELNLEIETAELEIKNIIKKIKRKESFEHQMLKTMPSEVIIPNKYKRRRQLIIKYNTDPDLNRAKSKLEKLKNDHIKNIEINECSKKKYIDNVRESYIKIKKEKENENLDLSDKFLDVIFPQSCPEYIKNMIISCICSNVEHRAKSIDIKTLYKPININKIFLDNWKLRKQPNICSGCKIKINNNTMFCEECTKIANILKFTLREYCFTPHEFDEYMKKLSLIQELEKNIN
jgi:hypothetical protein